MSAESVAFIRPVVMEDLDSLEQFSKEAGYGFVHLPRDRKLLKEKIEASLQAFSKNIEKPWHETYFFVLQVKDKIVGCSGIISRIGVSEPFFAYHLLTTSQECSLLKIKREIPVLHFIRARKKPTELCALFLQESFRHKDYGRLLSFGRFHFIAADPARFAPITIAELRGVCNEKGESFFWEAIGRHFFGMDFPEANNLRIFHPECVEELFPHYPIYPMLLQKEAQQSIGVPHSLTIPAWKLLQKQGFSLSHYIDLFDAGPHVYAHTQSIRTVKDSKIGTVQEVRNELSQGRKALLSNERLAFRACFSLLENSKENLIIDKATAQVLQVETGDTIRYHYAEEE